ncbi:MAG TPA: ABC transporter substrate binding protein [Candidatus Sulfotelmatobacter sp.]|nr:ABC transporter substrate binding protein [Candidatus Sulfotelmatobacter sp.]
MLKLAILLLPTCLVFKTDAAAQIKETRRVLILNELGSDVDVIDQELFTALGKAPYHIEFYIEDLDTSLLLDNSSQHPPDDWFHRKYADLKPDLIITVGLSTVKVMAESHHAFAPNTPIVFWGGTDDSAEPPGLDSDFTGVWGAVQPDKTLEAALRLQPGIKHVVVVGGVAPYDRHLETIVKERFRKYESNLEFTYLTDLAMPALLEQLRHLPSNTIVYHTSMMQDAAGTHFLDATQSVPMEASAANAPVFVVDDTDVGRGAVGGDVTSFVLAGRAAAGMALRILNGEKPQDIPIVKGTDMYLFDWRALRRWGLKERDLPSGSVVIGREPTLWEAYQREIVSGIVALVVQTLVIIALLWQRAKRKQTEAQLIRYGDRLRLAMESGKSVGWEWDLTSGRDSWFGDLRTMFGISSGTFTGKVGDFFLYVHPEDRKQVLDAMTSARQTRKPYIADYRILWPDGTTRWIVARGEFEYARNGAPIRMLGMAVDITDLKRAEHAEQVAENRFRQLFATLPEYCFVTSADGAILDINSAACSALGYSREELIGKPLSLLYAPGELTRLLDLSEKWKNMGKLHNEEIEVLTKSGQKRTVLANAGSLRDTHGNLLHTMTVQVDITDRKQAEAVLQESEERFRRVANTAPAMIWMAGADKLCTYFNSTWLQFTGRAIEQELGNGWAEGFHPDDFQGYWKTYMKAFDRREPFQMEYRLRRYDGEYRWMFAQGVPRLNSDGSFAGYIGSCIDVTDRKIAQEALSDMSRQLIEAHEQERTWIARELHDDINQQAALLAVNLEHLKQHIPSLGPAVVQRLEEMLKLVIGLGNDIQALSHRLHSSKLEYLGIVAAASSFCRELSGKHGVQIDFHSEAVPKELPQEIALCLFRVLQEGLQNAIKHSGSQRFEVWLTGASNKIELDVRDAGIGFNPEQAMRGLGLGLTSMRERLKLVHGELSIDSQSGLGTIVRASVPLSSGSKAAYA